ncbi:hypothetical protein [Pinirhizobacter soli]|uniref:hypothetical protein n=1 Tax=Pinirhizobacter soli TaxID=2786953 RepID=UPI00202A4684|nr:hypothetical protein [Pinirhizobacter soli]
MDVDVPPMLSFTPAMFHRVLPRVFMSANSQGSSVSAQLGNVRHAGPTAFGRPAIPTSPHSRARELLLEKAQLKPGASREFAINIVKNAGAARCKGDYALAGHILATGLATFFSASGAAAGDDTPSKPDAVHAGWQANLGRGVAALIARAETQLQMVQQDANADVVDHHPSRDGLLEALIRFDGGITATYRLAIVRATMLTNEGRHDEALAALREAPAHQAIMNHFAAPVGAPGSDSSLRALSTAHDALDKFQTLVNGDDDAPTGSLGQQVSYARDNPDVLRVRGLVQSVGAELFRVGDYGAVLDTVRPPLPPRVSAGGQATCFPPSAAAGGGDTSAATSPTLVAQSLAASSTNLAPELAKRATVSESLPEILHAGWRANLGRGVTALIAQFDTQLTKLRQDIYRNVVDGHSSRDALLEATREDSRMMVENRFAIRYAEKLSDKGAHDKALVVLREAPEYQRVMMNFKVSSGAEADAADHALSTSRDALSSFQAVVDDDGNPAGVVDEEVKYARENPDVLRTRELVRSVGDELFRLGAYREVLTTVRPPVPPRIVAGSSPKL